jgi:hypothetical protein
MPGILWEVTEHALRIKLGSKLVQQLLRRFDEEKRRAIDGRLKSFWWLDSSRKCIILSG